MCYKLVPPIIFDRGLYVFVKSGLTSIGILQHISPYKYIYMILFDDWIPRCFKALLMMMKPACTMISASFFHGEPGSEADHFGGGFEPFQRHIHHPSHCQVLGDSAALEGMLEEARSRMDPCGSSAVSQAEIGIRCPKNGEFCYKYLKPNKEI